MFVRSRMTRDMVYRKGGKEWVIKAGTISSIDENVVTAYELKSLYGSRIDIIARGVTDEVKPTKPVKSEAPKKLESKKVEPPKKLDTNLIDNILNELKGEADKKEKAEKPTTKPVKKPAKKPAKKTSGEKATKKTTKKGTARKYKKKTQE